MFHTYRYEARAAAWGVVVSLTAEAVPRAEHPGAAEAVAEGLSLSVPDPGPVSGGRPFPGLTAEEHGCLRLGLRLVAGRIRACAPTRLPLVVCVRALEFAECDFQPEGLACALAGWAAEEFGFPPVPIPFTFDRHILRYRFEFPRLDDDAPP